VTIAYAGARALTRALSRDRSQLAGGLLLDLALNAAWIPLFFRARRPRAALAEIACLNIANVLLIRQTWRADRTAARTRLYFPRARPRQRATRAPGPPSPAACA
jgi:benzodiazapine receptor